MLSKEILCLISQRSYNVRNISANEDSRLSHALAGLDLVDMVSSTIVTLNASSYHFAILIFNPKSFLGNFFFSLQWNDLPVKSSLGGTFWWIKVLVKRKKSAMSYFSKETFWNSFKDFFASGPKAEMDFCETM